MKSSTTASSSMPSPLPKKFHKGGRTKGVSSPANAPIRHRGPTNAKGHNHQMNKEVVNAKSGKPRKSQSRRKRRKIDHPKRDMPPHCPSLSSSSPPGALLERIGGTIEDEALMDVDRIDGGGVDSYADLPFSTAPHVYTPDQGEVERFLESVIGAPPSPGPVRACLAAYEPTLALETHNLPVDRLVKAEEVGGSTLYSPTSNNPTLDYCRQSPPMGDAMASPSASTIEECRKLLAPVLLASAQEKDPGICLDSEQLLSDDHCRVFFRQAKEMRLQLSSLDSQKIPANQGWSGSLKRDRVDDVDPWVRNTRSRFSSLNTVVPDVSRRDSDIALTDFSGGKLPPRAPRAMLQASRDAWDKSSDDTRDEVPYKALVASPTAEGHLASATLLTEPAHQITKILPTLPPTSQPMAEIDAANTPVGMWTGDHSKDPGDVASLTSPKSADLVLHLPTQPGIWFRQQGKQHAQIVDVDIDVGDEMFYMSRERQSSRLRMHVRLCSVPVATATENDIVDVPAWLRDIDGSTALRWPTKGKLVVQVNPECERSKTWLPHALASDPLDVTSCMRPGKNTFRFIQLSDLSEFAFVLAASPPPPDEEWRNWDWASLVERSYTGPSSPSPRDDPMNGLSEFAHIPAIVRS